MIRVLGLLLMFFVVTGCHSATINDDSAQERFDISPVILSGYHPFEQSIAYLHYASMNHDNEYIDYDLNVLPKYLKSLGWQLKSVHSDSNQRYGDKTLDVTLTKAGQSVKLDITFFKPGTHYAHQKFIYDLTKDGFTNPPYRSIPYNNELVGTLAVYRMINRSDLHFFYRNAYVKLTPSTMLGHPSDAEMQLAINIQAVFKKHLTRDINIGPKFTRALSRNHSVVNVSDFSVCMRYQENFMFAKKDLMDRGYFKPDHETHGDAVSLIRYASNPSLDFPSETTIQLSKDRCSLSVIAHSSPYDGEQIFPTFLSHVYAAMGLQESNIKPIKLSDHPYHKYDSEMMIDGMPFSFVADSEMTNRGIYISASIIRQKVDQQ